MKVPAKLSPIISSLRPTPGYLRSVEYTAIALAIITLSGLIYLSSNVYESRSAEVTKLEVDDAQLTKQIKELKIKVKGDSGKGDLRKARLDRLQEFNERFLKDQTQGRLILIDQLNELITKNNMTLQGGINFAIIEDIDVVEAQLKEEKGRTRRSKGASSDVYPGLRASFNVGGSYEDFRRFLYNLESSDMFLIVERLNLQSGKNDASLTGGRQRSQVVQLQDDGKLSVQFEIKTYFRKQAIAVNATDATN